MPPEYVRRSNRIAREIAILLVGSDMEGKVFSEQTKTVLLSRHGAGIVSQYVLSAEQELILRRLDTDKEVEVHVVGQLGHHGESHTYGVAFLDAEVDLWGVDFPSMTDSEKEASRVLLQCSSCKAREMVQQATWNRTYTWSTKGSSVLARGAAPQRFGSGLLKMAAASPFGWKARHRKLRKVRSRLRLSRPRHRIRRHRRNPRCAPKTDASTCALK